MRTIFVLAVIGLVGEASQPAAVPTFEALYTRSQDRQTTIISLGSRFTETTVSSLLVEPVIEHGTLVAVKPGRVAMNYTSAEPRTVTVDDTRLIVRWPQRNRHETLSIAETQERVRRYFTGASPSELRGYFDITVSRDPKVPRTYRIDMQPRRDQIRRGLDLLQIWVDEETTLMSRMRMAFPGGDSKDIQLQDVRVNVPVDEDVFTALPGVTPTR